MPNIIVPGNRENYKNGIGIEMDTMFDYRLVIKKKSYCPESYAKV